MPGCRGVRHRLSQIAAGRIDSCAGVFCWALSAARPGEVPDRTQRPSGKPEEASAEEADTGRDSGEASEPTAPPGVPSMRGDCNLGLMRKSG
jgi:hypothetical protein